MNETGDGVRGEIRHSLKIVQVLHTKPKLKTSGYTYVENNQMESYNKPIAFASHASWPGSAQ